MDVVTNKCDKDRFDSMLISRWTRLLLWKLDSYFDAHLRLYNIIGQEIYDAQVGDC